MIYVTNDGEVDVSVASLRQPEVDATAVQSLVFWFDVGQNQSGRMAIRSEGGPLSENFTAGPLLGDAEIRVPRVHTANENKNIDITKRERI